MTVKGLLFSSILLSHIAFANVKSVPFTEESCLKAIGDPRKDKAEFGPQRDQDGAALCWAFAGAALMEEELCKQSKSHPDLKYKCGDSLSPLDAYRCRWKIGNKRSEEGTPWEGARYALDCILGADPGICKEEDAPFYSDWRNRSDLEVMSATHYERFRSCDQRADASRIVREFQGSLAKYFRQNYIESPASSSLFYLESEKFQLVLDLFNQSNSSQELVQKILFPERCQKNRIVLPEKRIPNTIAFETIPETGFNPDFAPSPEKILEKVAAIRKVFEQGRSVSLGLCSRRIRKGPGAPCGDHDLVASDFRWNPTGNKCEILIKNSWGEGSSINGWQDINVVLGYTYGMTYLEDDK